MSSYASVPGVVETSESFGETTLVVDPARLSSCIALRDGTASIPLGHRRPDTRLVPAEARGLHRPRRDAIHMPAPRSHPRAPSQAQALLRSYHLLRVSASRSPFACHVWGLDTAVLGASSPSGPCDWFER